MCALPSCVASKDSSHDLPMYPREKRLCNRHASPPNGRPMYATRLRRLQWSAYVRIILAVPNPISGKERAGPIPLRRACRWRVPGEGFQRGESVRARHLAGAKTPQFVVIPPNATVA